MFVIVVLLVHAAHRGDGLLEIVINNSEPVPVFAQLIEQIKKAVLSDKLGPGAPLPSIRQLANDLELNHNTVAKAYRLLERDAVIQTRGYRGTYVHPEAKANCDIDLNKILTAKLSDTIRELRETGATDSEIRIAFGKVMKNSSNQGE